MKVGVNLEGIADWDRSGMFINVLKHSRPLGTADSPTGEGVASVLPNAYPTGEGFGFRFATNVPGLAGVYKCSCRGKADSISLIGPGSVGPLSFEGGRTTCDVTLNPDIDDREKWKNQWGNDWGTASLVFRGSGLWDCKLLRPGYLDDKQIFTESFMIAIRPFAALRAMDLLLTNDSTLVHWADRPHIDDPCYGQSGSGVATANGSKGIPYEILFELCNQTGKGCVLTVPHLVDSGYVSNLIQLMRGHLSQKTPRQIAVSNEVWNWQFGQAQDNLKKAREWAKTRPDVKEFLNKYLNDDDNGWRWVYYAERVVRLSLAFAAAGVPVEVNFETQIGWGGLDGLKRGLQYIEHFYGPPKAYIAAISGAPYFGGSMYISTRGGLTVDDLFGPYGYTYTNAMTNEVTESAKGDNYLFDRAASIRTDGNMKLFFELARQYGVEARAYEGGLDISRGGSPAAILAAMSDQRMMRVCEENLNGWFDQGGGLFNIFSLTSPWGDKFQWGMTDDVRDLDKPKYLAAAYVAAQLAPPTKGNQTMDGQKLTGTPFGSAGAWNGSGNDITKAFDGDPATFVDVPQADGAVVGLDLGAPAAITGIRYSPRTGYAGRMTGGRFQGSTDGQKWTDLGTVQTIPQDGVFAAITATGAFRYIRYVAPTSAYGNVAEIEVYGTPASPAPPVGPAEVDFITITYKDKTTRILR